MRERLQKIIAAAGLMSRRTAEEAISAGRVRVNGAVAALGDQADPAADEILLDGRPLPAEERKVYLMLHKPRGVVTTLSDEKGRRSVRDLVADAGARVYPVGRLDLDSEGLLLMTNDGDFANLLTHPSHEISKTYHTWVTGEDLDTAAERLSRPMELDGRPIRPARVELLHRGAQEACLSVTIHEGRNRQVRRMCELCSLRVTRLRRVSEGALRLGDLPSGKWRHLTEEEIRSFYIEGNKTHET